MKVDITNCALIHIAIINPVVKWLLGNQILIAYLLHWDPARLDKVIGLTLTNPQHITDIFNTINNLLHRSYLLK